MDVQGGWPGGSAAAPGLKKFQGKLCFQSKRKLLKNPECKSIFNTVKNSRATLFSGQAPSCSKILDDKKYIFNTVKNSRATLFFRASASSSKILNVKSIFNTVENSRATLLFRASASCSKILNNKNIYSGL